MVAGGKEFRKSSKKRKKKPNKTENDKNTSNECRYVENDKKDYVRLTSKLPAIVNHGRVDSRHKGVPAGPTLNKLPHIQKNTFVKHRITEPIRTVPVYEEQSSDSSSLFSASRYENYQGLKRYRDTAHVARDHLVSLMPPINAKRYTFSKGMIAGAKQELTRLKKLMGRDNVSSEQSHFESVMSEQRRRAASINAFLSGNTENKTNNSQSKFLSRVPEKHNPTESRVAGSKYEDKLKANKSRAPRGCAVNFLSVLKSSKTIKTESIVALRNAFYLSKVRPGFGRFAKTIASQRNAINQETNRKYNHNQDKT